jgi:hypothetical protein
MNGLYKVGLTTNSVAERMSQLQTTGVPTDFELIHKYELPENYLEFVEREIHNALKEKTFMREKNSLKHLRHKLKQR